MTLLTVACLCHVVVVGLAAGFPRWQALLASARMPYILWLKREGLATTPHLAAHMVAAVACSTEAWAASGGSRCVSQREG